jgi:hypothetical protein
MFACSIKGSKHFTGSPALHMRLPSLRINAPDPECYPVWTSNAAMQSANRLWIYITSLGTTAFAVKHKFLLNAHINGFDQTRV